MRCVAVLIGLVPIIAWGAAGAPFVAASVAPEWYCETICAGGCGGRPRYDARKQVCRCAIGERIDDGDMELINKTARIVNMKIEFYADSVDKVKRSPDDREEEQKAEKKAQFPRFPQAVAFPPLKPLFGDLAARLQGEEPKDALLGQIDPGLEDVEPHHNVYAAPPAHGKHLFGGPILGYAPIPVGFGAPAQGYPPHLTPALTRSLLMNVREKLDNLLLRTQQYPYQPAVTAHETESMRNTLKQITQVNVNVRPHGTTWGYFFNNLVNQLAPMLRAEGPQHGNPEGDVEGASLVRPEGDVMEEVKEKKGHKSGKVALELGKKTSTKSTSTKASEEEIVTDAILKTTPSTSTTVRFIDDQEEEDTPTVPTPQSPKPTETTTLQFLPVEEGDDVVGEDYHYDEDHLD